ncbi:MAG: hypothetical protein AB4426_01840 [Xenococcaceae cyanobacterium]
MNTSTIAKQPNHQSSGSTDSDQPEEFFLTVSDYLENLHSRLKNNKKLSPEIQSELGSLIILLNDLKEIETALPKIQSGEEQEKEQEKEQKKEQEKEQEKEQINNYSLLNHFLKMIQLGIDDLFSENPSLEMITRLRGDLELGILQQRNAVRNKHPWKFLSGIGLRSPSLMIVNGLLCFVFLFLTPLALLVYFSAQVVLQEVVSQGEVVILGIQLGIKAPDLVIKGFELFIAALN